jgi:hypothetical protein
MPALARAAIGDSLLNVVTGRRAFMDLSVENPSLKQKLTALCSATAIAGARAGVNGREPLLTGLT